MLLAAAVLALVNGQRVAHHEQPLSVSPLLEREARDLGPAAFCSRSRGENTAWGTGRLATPRPVVRAWMASAPHRVNILDPRYRFTGVGVVRRGRVTFYTQEFAEPCAST